VTLRRSRLAKPFGALAAWLAVAVTGGCSFNSTGRPQAPTDGLIPEVDFRQDAALPDLKLDHRLDAPHDGIGDQHPDLSLDSAPDPRCLAHPQGSFCHFEDATDPGQVGSCVGGQYLLDHYCFVNTICQKGKCIPQGCNPCDSCSNGTCSVFSVNDYCCTYGSKNGTGTAVDACTNNSQCQSGYCTTERFCYQWCSFHSDHCPANTQCRLLKINDTLEAMGCARFQPDASVPDGPALDAGAQDAPFDLISADSDDGSSSDVISADSDDGSSSDLTDGTDSGGNDLFAEDLFVDTTTLDLPDWK
jgi:hypothetical protein